MNDLISRRAAIDAVHEEFDGCLVWDESGETTADEVERVLSYLPSVEPKQKHGKWIRLSNYLAQCSECKDYIDNAISCGYNYCPNCGARMDGETE